MAVVDDDASVLKALARLLRASGYEVATFASGTEFLESLKMHVPDCLVLDVHMPSIGGLDVQTAMLDRGVRVPIIFITAYDDKGLRERALEQDRLFSRCSQPLKRRSSPVPGTAKCQNNRRRPGRLDHGPIARLRGNGIDITFRLHPPCLQSSCETKDSPPASPEGFFCTRDGPGLGRPTGRGASPFFPASALSRCWTKV